METQTQDKFMLRLPDGLRHVIKEAALRNRRSMNAEIVVHLEGAFRHAAADHDAPERVKAAGG
jgi:predicted HicB family RNase H-like nuclease